MQLRSLLPSIYHRIVILILVVAYLFSLGSLLLITVPVYAILLYLFRYEFIRPGEKAIEDKDIIWAPVSGAVKGVYENISHPIFGENLKVISILNNFHEGPGLYFPISSEVKEIFEMEGESVMRFKNFEKKFNELKKYRSIQVYLEDSVGHNIGIEMYKCSLGMLPELKILSGDRGVKKTNFGLIPYGGKILIYLPENSELNVRTGDKIDSTKTTIARYK